MHPPRLSDRDAPVHAGNWLPAVAVQKEQNRLAFLPQLLVWTKPGLGNVHLWYLGCSVFSSQVLLNKLFQRGEKVHPPPFLWSVAGGSLVMAQPVV